MSTSPDLPSTGSPAGDDSQRSAASLAPVPATSLAPDSVASSPSPSSPSQSAPTNSASGSAPASGVCVWSSQDDDKLLDVLEEAQRQKRQSGGGFKPEVWKKAVDELAPLREKGGLKGKKEVQSHWRNLKQMWKEVRELVNLSGFGWSEDAGRVTAEDDVWDELIKRQPRFKKWRNKTFVLYPRVDALSAQSTATGSFARDGKGKSPEKDAESGKDGQGEGGEDEEEDDSDDEDDIATPSRKRKRPSAVSAIADIAVALKDMGNQDEGLGDALAKLLERDSDVFDEDELALLGMALADKPRLASVYRSYVDREELRRKFLRKVLDTDT